MAWNEAVAQAYARMVRAGTRKIEDIYPDDLRQRVQEILSGNEAV